MRPRLYAELADWWALVSPVEWHEILQRVGFTAAEHAIREDDDVRLVFVGRRPAR